MSTEDVPETETISPPNKNDILFPKNNRNEDDARIDLTVGNYIYRNGFRDAAKLIVKANDGRKTSHQFLIYPLVYLYRHYIELTLKDMIESECFLLDIENCERIKIIRRAKHDLNRLWQEVESRLNCVCERSADEPFPDSELEGVDSYIRQLNDCDPKGESFRYVFDYDGKTPTIKSNVNMPDIQDFFKKIESFAEYLETIEAWLAERTDAYTEFKQKYNDNRKQT